MVGNYLEGLEQNCCGMLNRTCRRQKKTPGLPSKLSWRKSDESQGSGQRNIIKILAKNGGEIGIRMLPAKTGKF